MNIAIDFYDEPMLKTTEISDEAIDRVLPSKFHPIKSPVTQTSPEKGFGNRWRVSKESSLFSQMAIRHHIPPASESLPFSRGRRRG